MPQENQKLTDKQRRFVEEYLVSHDASKAARAAGYSEKMAGRMGYQLKRKPEVAAEIERRDKAVAERAGLNAEYVRKMWADIIATCSQKVAATGAGGEPLLTDDGQPAYKMLDAITARNTLKDVADHLQMFEKPEEEKNADDGTGVMLSPGMKTPEEWDA